MQQKPSVTHLTDYVKRDRSRTRDSPMRSGTGTYYTTYTVKRLPRQQPHLQPFTRIGVVVATLPRYIFEKYGFDLRPGDMTYEDFALRWCTSSVELYTTLRLSRLFFPRLSLLFPCVLSVFLSDYTRGHYNWSAASLSLSPGPRWPSIKILKFTAV